ncbi:hypothetical protein [Pontibacter anaerobius]|uniref:YceI-like domain-containing protein n=1 Tax=Pontibacter anaerobius TaxID=2993940 RepID=A0ABT3RKS8_9BACT|nr:hypothetical protein [Pontibacter anaerobius]MCX2741805.1 hypothetical protein [Pontibacter anaerobius]
MQIKLYLLYLLLLFPLLFPASDATAQRNREPYTGNNRVLLALDGYAGRYQFISEQVLVRYNKDLQQLECVVPVETLVPLHDSIPQNMAYEVLFGAVYPQLYITLAAPVQQINAGSLSPETRRLSAAVRIQDVTDDTVVPVSFVPENNSFHFSTTFDLNLENFQASIPVAYVPLLTGRLLITVDRAHWIDLKRR